MGLQFFLNISLFFIFSIDTMYYLQKQHFWIDTHWNRKYKSFSLLKFQCTNSEIDSKIYYGILAHHCWVTIVTHLWVGMGRLENEGDGIKPGYSDCKNYSL